MGCCISRCETEWNSDGRHLNAQPAHLRNEYRDSQPLLRLMLLCLLRLRTELGSHLRRSGWDFSILHALCTVSGETDPCILTVVIDKMNGV